MRHVFTRGRAGIFGKLLACVALAAGAARAHTAEAPPTAGWKGFTLFVWQYKTPPPGPEAKRLYDSLNLHALHLDNGFSDELLRFAKENDFAYYVDHAAGKGDLYLSPADWDAFLKGYRQDRTHPVRPRSLWDPALRERLKRTLRDNITRARNGPALAYAFDDEISVTSFTSPADLDQSPEGLARFRAWLRVEYKTLDALNSQWETGFARWDDVTPKGVDDLSGVYGLPFPQWNLGPWLDHRRFMDSEWAELLSDLTKEANALDPLRPAGFVGGQAPAAYGGFDYARLADSVGWMEAYDIGGTDEILRSFWGTRRPRVQTYFLTDDAPKDIWFLWRYLAHGCRGVICWPESGKGPWFQGAEARPEVRALADTFREIQGPVGSLLTGAEFQSDGIGLYYSQPSLIVSWLMDVQPHGRTWVNRSSSMNNENASDLLNRVAWMKLLEDAGFQYDVVSYRNVERLGVDALKKLRVLILPRTLALSDREATAIRAFVRRGGTLIADYLPGVFDGHGRGRKTGALDDLFGVNRPETPKAVLDGRTVAEVNAELHDQPLSARLSYNGALRTRDGRVVYERALRLAGRSRSAEEAGGTVVDVTNAQHTGMTHYMNWTPLPYLIVRGTESGELYRAQVANLMKIRRGNAQTALTPRARIFGADGRRMFLAECLFWRKGKRNFICVVMNPRRTATIDSPGGLDIPLSTSSQEIMVRFTAPVHGLRNERTGRLMGDGIRFRTRWLPYEALVYSWPAALSKEKRHVVGK